MLDHLDTTAVPASLPEAGLWRGIAEVVAEKGLDPVITALIPDMLIREARLTEPAVPNYFETSCKGATAESGRGGALALAQWPGSAGLIGEIDVPDADPYRGFAPSAPSRARDGELALGLPSRDHPRRFERGDTSHEVIESTGPASVLHSFFNDLAVDGEQGAMTSSDPAGGDNAALVVDLETERARRVLDGHQSGVLSHRVLFQNDETINSQTDSPLKNSHGSDNPEGFHVGDMRSSLVALDRTAIRSSWAGSL